MQTVPYHYTEEVQTYKAFSESAGHMLQRKAMPPLRDNKIKVQGDMRATLMKHMQTFSQFHASLCVISVKIEDLQYCLCSFSSVKTSKFCPQHIFCSLFGMKNTGIIENIFGFNTRKTCSADIVVYNILVKSSQNYSVKNVIGKKGAR